MAWKFINKTNCRVHFLYRKNRYLLQPLIMYGVPQFNHILLVPVQITFPQDFETGLVSSGTSLISWEEGASLPLVTHPSSDGVTIKMLYG